MLGSCRVLMQCASVYRRKKSRILTVIRDRAELLAESSALTAMCEQVQNTFRKEYEQFFTKAAEHHKFEWLCMVDNSVRSLNPRINICLKLLVLGCFRVRVSPFQDFYVQNVLVY